MIAFLKGTIAAIEMDGVILEVNQVGYRIYMPVSLIERELGVGQEVCIHTYLHVKEDALSLFGFLSRDDLMLFEMLIGVNGIGPRAALSILSELSADDLRFAILSDDAASIAKAPGVGKKTAQKVILELKDKLNLEDAFEEKLSHQAGGIGAGELPGAAEDAIEALVALGYPAVEARQAVRAVPDQDTLEVETLLREALKNL